jgi:thiamine kinase-like enzyme
MMLMPQNPGEFNAEWLTMALRKGGAIKDASVTAIDVRTIGEGAGFIGQLAQIRPTYDRDEPGAPVSIIAKMPGASEGGRQIGNLFDFYNREIRFYEEIAEEVELRTPKRYYSESDPENQRYILLIEDLAPASVGDQLTGCPLAHARLAIESIAKFHATWWESPRLKEIAAWMPAINAPVQQVAAGAYAQAWQPFLDMFGAGLSAEVRSACERIGENVVKIQTAFAQPPLTISHGDYRVDNLFFASEQGGYDFAVADWQISTLGRGAFDVAYLLCGGLPSELRRKHERELVKLYHDTLTANGVSDYTLEHCWEDYRLGALFQFVYIVIAVGTLDAANERGMALWTAWLQRGATAVEELKAIECMPA